MTLPKLFVPAPRVALGRSLWRVIGLVCQLLSKLTVKALLQRPLMDDYLPLLF